MKNANCGYLNETGAINALLIVGVLICSVVCLFLLPLEPFMIVVFIAYIITLTVGMVYALKGYTKAAAPFYKFYMVAFAVCCLLEMLRLFTSGGNVLVACLNLLSFLGLALLAFTLDLGKSKSMAVVFIVLLAALTDVVLILIMDRRFETVVGTLQQLAGAYTLLMSVLAKYMDKADRGSK